MTTVPGEPGEPVNPESQPGNAHASPPEWNQAEAIAFESARECINDLIGIQTSLVEKERRRQTPDAAAIEALQSRVSALVDERMSLRLKDREGVQRVREAYGAEVRAFRASRNLPGE